MHVLSVFMRNVYDRFTLYNFRQKNKHKSYENTTPNDRMELNGGYHLPWPDAESMPKKNEKFHGHKIFPSKVVKPLRRRIQSNIR